MKVAMMQPAFMPWLGFFELAAASECFVLLDDFQFSRQSHHQRNRFFLSPGAPGLCVVPVTRAEEGFLPLSEVMLDERSPWRTKLLKRIRQGYSKAPWFAAVFPLVQRWMESTVGKSLAEMNIFFILEVSGLLGISPRFSSSSVHPSRSRRSMRVLELLRASGASTYYCARGSYGYMAEDGAFPVPDIQVLFQDFHPAPYPQAGNQDGFVPRLSVLDALMNAGPEETRRLVLNGTSRWWTWEDMSRACGSPTLQTRQNPPVTGPGTGANP